MQVIGKIRLRDFGAEHDRGASSLWGWYQLVSSTAWESPEVLAETLPSIEFHGNLAAFNIRGGSYYAISTVDFTRQQIYLRTMLMYTDARTGEWKKIDSAAPDSAHFADQSYQDLVGSFPLRPISDDDALREALSRLDELVAIQERTADLQDYLDVLSLIISDYESRKLSLPPVSGAEVLRTLIAEHHLSQAELIPLLGSKEKTLAVLNGSRPLDLRQVTRACRYFKLPPETFLDPEDFEPEIPRAARRRG